MGAINILVFCQNIVCAGLVLLAFVIFSQIALPWFALSKVVSFSPSMKLYIWCTIFLCIVSFPTHLYYIFLWQDSDVAIYNAFVIWHAGNVISFVMIDIPFRALFLCIERCCIIAIPSFVAHRFNRFLAFIAILSILAACVLVFFLDNLPEYPESSQTMCRNFACVTGKSTIPAYLLIRYSCAFTSVIAGLVCVFLVRTKLKGSSTETTANKVIFTTLIYTFLLDILPNSIDGIFLLVTFKSFIKLLVD